MENDVKVQIRQYLIIPEIMVFEYVCLVCAIKEAYTHSCSSFDLFRGMYHCSLQFFSAISKQCIVRQSEFLVSQTSIWMVVANQIYTYLMTILR